jgi:hypothetical protein
MWHPIPYFRPTAEFAAQCVLRSCAPTELDPAFGLDRRTAKGRLEARQAQDAAAKAAGPPAAAGRRTSVDLSNRLGRGSLDGWGAGAVRAALHEPANGSSGGGVEGGLPTQQGLGAALGGGGGELRPESSALGTAPQPSTRRTLLPSWTPDYHALNPTPSDADATDGPADVELDPMIEALLGRLGMAVPARRASAMPAAPSAPPAKAQPRDWVAATGRGGFGGRNSNSNNGSSEATGDLLQLDAAVEVGGAPAAPAPPLAINFEGMDPETAALLARLNFRGSGVPKDYRPKTPPMTPPPPPPPDEKAAPQGSQPPAANTGEGESEGGVVAVDLIDRTLLELDERPFARGGGGQIFKGTYLGNPVAAKEVASLGSGAGAAAREAVGREVATLAGLAHPSVLALYGISQNPGPDAAFYVVRVAISPPSLLGVSSNLASASVLISLV